MTESAAWRVLVRTVLLVFALLLAAYVVHGLKTVILQFLVALLIAAAATPLVDAMTSSERPHRWPWRPPRALAVLIVFLGVVLLLVGGLFAIGAAVVPELGAFASNLPLYAARLQSAFDDLLVRNPDVASALPTNAGLPPLSEVLGSAAGLLVQVSRVLAVATGVFSGALYAIFTLVLALYLTIDGDRIRRYAISLLPFEWHAQTMRASARIGDRLGAWARGEALLGAIIGGLTWLAALVLGLPYAGALALIAGVGELIPNLGPILAAIPFVFVGFLVSPTHGLLALAAAVLIQQLENNLIVPRVMGKAVELHPVVVMLAILSGNELLGVPGALLAVPTVAAFAVVVDELQQERLARHNRELLSEEALPDPDVTRKDTQPERTTPPSVVP